MTLLRMALIMYTYLYVLLNYVWIDGKWWNEVGMSHISLFGFVKIEWNGMEWSVMEPIPFNTTYLANFSFPQFKVYPMKWNTLIIQLQFCPYFFYFISAPHSLFFLFILYYSFTLSSSTNLHRTCLVLHSTKVSQYFVNPFAALLFYN